MMKTVAVLLLLLSVTLPISPAAAQSEELAPALERYRLTSERGDYRAAEAIAREALELGERGLGPAEPLYATLVFHLGQALGNQRRYTEAEPLIRRSLELREAALGPGHPDVAESLHNLASLYFYEGRSEEAIPLQRRALSIRETALGRDHPSVAETLSNLALTYKSLGRMEDVEAFYRRALAIREKALGPDHPDVSYSLNNLAMLSLQRERPDEAEQLLVRALAIKEKALGPTHPSVATTLANLALVGRAQGKFFQLESLFLRALEIRENALGPDHPDTITSLNHLAWLYSQGGALPESLDLARRIVAAHRERMERSGDLDKAALARLRLDREDFLGFLSLAVHLSEKDPTARERLLAEAFEAAQLAQATGAAAAVSRMAARFATGDDALARLVRERQDAAERYERVDGALVHAVGLLPSQRDGGSEKEWRGERDRLGAQIREIGARLVDSHPRYAELSQPKPARLTEIQALLAPDEALIAYHVGRSGSYLFAVRHDRAMAQSVAVAAEALRDAVANLRQSLDLSGVSALSDLRAFNTTNAHELYRILFAPAERLLDGARHIFIVPDGALQSLPLGVLVTAPPAETGDVSADYRAIPWLVRKYAMTVLPSVASLRALRQFARASRAGKPFMGIGDPELEGRPGVGRGAAQASLFTERGVADVRSVRSLAALPDTADELKALARTLDAGKGAVVTGREATEAWIKAASLEDRRIIAFATHGLVAGDLEGLAEPALVLTPPSEGTERDDGLLTASEVAQLKLDADWVILSACNTAAGDGTPDADGLSGLAKAFFYAGTRTLLVSHWPVASTAAVQITTRMLAEAAKPGVGRAEAHRRAMLSMLAETEPLHFAHPAFWAPFIVVGEGGLAPP